MKSYESIGNSNGLFHRPPRGASAPPAAGAARGGLLPGWGDGRRCVKSPLEEALKRLIQKKDVYQREATPAAMISSMRSNHRPGRGLKG